MSFESLSPQEIMPQLRVSMPGGRERSFNFARRALVGRDGSNDLQLDDPSVSSHHALIHLDQSGLLCVTDLRSSNGTYLNGTLVQRASLEIGSVLALGSCRLEVTDIEWRRATPGPLPGAELLDQDTTLNKSAQRQPTPDLEALHRGWGDLLTLYELGHLLRTGRGEDQVYGAVCDLVARATGAQRVTLVEHDPLRGRLRGLYAWPDGVDPNGGRPYSRTLLDEVIRQGRTILVPDVALSSSLRHAPSIQLNAIRSVLAAPLHGYDRVAGIILATHHEAGFEFQEHQVQLLTAIGQEVGMALENHRLFWRVERNFLGTLEALVQALDARDPYTAGHSLRVAEMSLAIGRWVPLDDDRLKELRLGALLHDVGKIGVDDACLRSNRKLTSEEFAHIQQHTVLGGQILNPLAALDATRSIVRHHHERWDGEGYPDGLAGERIPLTSRIVAVADTIDAITSDRPYRRGSPLDLALHEVEHHAGTQFDPAIVRATLRAAAAGELARFDKVGNRAQYKGVAH